MPKLQSVDPLSEDQLEELLEAANEKTLQTEFIVRTLARTGMRASELAHMQAGWVNENDWQVEITPPLPDCECQDCTSKAEQSDTRDLEDYWMPKSDAGLRVIPVSTKPEYSRFREVLTEYFDKHDEVPVSRGSVYYHVEKMEDEVSFDCSLKPHDLRHTFGTLAAHQGATQSYLKDVMGHANIESTEVYIKLSGRQVREQHDDVW